VVTAAARHDVVVLGAGCAGLTAAVGLARRGARVLVLEARGKLGGRATSFVDRATGELVDNGQHVLLGCYHETLRLLETLGALDRVVRAPSLDAPFVDEAGNWSRLHCPPLPSPWHLVAGVLRWRGLSWSDRLSVFRLARVLRAARGRPPHEAAAMAPADQTVAQWLAAHGQGDRLRAMLWEPLALAALNQDIRVASASAFLPVLAGVFGPDPADAAVVLPRVPLDEMYAEPARAEIERLGGEVRANALAHVAFDGERLAGIDVRGERVAAPQVVVATGWFSLASVLRDGGPAVADLVRRASATAASPIVTVNLWFDRAVIDEPFVGLPGRRMQWVFDKQRIFGAGRASHLSLVSSGAQDIVRMSNDPLVALALDEVLGALPAARRARLERAVVVREPNATFSLAPGQPARPGVRTTVEGLYLASDWVDTGLPATLESAVVAGRLAASAALADAGVRVAGPLFRQ
jgi:hydroxysqualene dehydroxylase